MKILLIVLMLVLTGCGQVDRLAAKFTGDATEVCHAGVL
jgi:uncharacterized protein YceK